MDSVQDKLRNRVRLRTTTTRDSRFLLEELHYLHRGRVGRQLHYFITLDGLVEGVITYAYPKQRAPITVEGRTYRGLEIIEFARLYLHQNIPHTASCAVGKSLRRIKEDWAATFPDAPPLALVVSYSDRVLHRGVIYRASNFRWHHHTVGKYHGPDHSKLAGPRPRHADRLHDKDCWVYPL